MQRLDRISKLTGLEPECQLPKRFDAVAFLEAVERDRVDTLKDARRAVIKALKHEKRAGRRVRSKQERLIDDILAGK